MATLRDSIIDNYQLNETILVYGGGNDSGYATVKFQQLGHTREEIVSEYAPELSPCSANTCRLPFNWGTISPMWNWQNGTNITSPRYMHRSLLVLKGATNVSNASNAYEKKQSCVSLVPFAFVTPSSWNETNTAS